MHAARLSTRLLHALYQRLEPHGDAQSADFDAPRQPLLERITVPDFALTSSVWCCTDTSSPLEIVDDFVTSLEYTFSMSKPEKTQQKRLPKGRPFAGVKRANIKALKLGMFNPTEGLDKMNEGAERPT